MAPYLIILVVIALLFPGEKISLFMEKRRSKKAAENAQRVLVRQNIMQQPIMPQNQNPGWQTPQDVQFPASENPQTSSEMPQEQQENSEKGTKEP